MKQLPDYNDFINYIESRSQQIVDNLIQTTKNNEVFEFEFPLTAENLSKFLKAINSQNVNSFLLMLGEYHEWLSKNILD